MRSGRAGWHNASRIVFLDDARSGPALPEISAVDDIGIAPPVGRAEKGAAHRLCDNHAFWQLCRGHEGGAGDIGETAPDHLEGDELDGLVGAGAVAIGLLVLDAVGFLECRESCPIIAPTGIGTSNSKDWPW